MNFSMRILGVDYGHKRIGLAYADELGVALPVRAATQTSFDERMEYIAKIVKERRVEKFVVGYPYNMDGTAGAKALEVDDFILKLKEKFSLPVDIEDERLTSFQAEAEISMFTSARKKSVQARKKQRAAGDVDSRAAAIILQEFLSNETL